MIMGSAKESQRDRADSISAFKRFGKIGGFNESSKPFETTPDCSPAIYSSS
jgi:hypothetical protein